MLQSRIFAGVWLIFISIFYIFDKSYLGFILLILTGVITLLLLINIILLKNKLSFTIHTEGTVHKDEQGALIINIKNKSLFPAAKLKANITCENKLTNEKVTDSFFMSLNARGTETIPLDIASKYCGQISVSVNSVYYYDFLGIFSSNMTIDSCAHLFILPNMFEIDLSVSDSDSGFEDSHVHEVNRRGQNGLEVFGIKEYGQEDSLKNVHWKLTSKFDQLIVKELSEAVNYTFLIMLDLTIIDHKDKNDPSVMDSMVESYVSLSEALLNKGYVHSIAWLDSEIDFIQVEHVHSIDELTFLLKKILLLEQTESKETILEKLVYTEYIERYSHIIHVTSEKSAVTSHNNLEHINVTELVCGLNEATHKQAKTYTPKTMVDELNQLSI